MRYYIGIDDTDNADSRGTGYTGRTMAARIAEAGLAGIGGISRHQLLFDSRVSYTSHNSSLCIEVDVDAESVDRLLEFMVSNLLKVCAPGSDCGLCMIRVDRVSQLLVDWGYAAKTDLINQLDGLNLAKREGITLLGLTGNHDGIIGSMAAVGLRASGNDGRFVALKGGDIRDISGVKRVSELKRMVEIHRVVTPDGEEVDDSSRIDTDKGWFRPVYRAGYITLLVNKIDKIEAYDYQLANKEYIKSISD